MAYVSMKRIPHYPKLLSCNSRSYVHRKFSSASLCQSGHNRWSKIKHDKGKDDAKKSRERSLVARELRQASSLSGPDIHSNPRLATLISSAKKLGFTKASIENAIAQGQGRSMTGEALASMTVEAMFPDSIAIIIECQTDSKARTLADIRSLIKDFGGSVAATKHLFRKKGKITFGGASNPGDDALFEHLIDTQTIGADFGDGDKLIVFTEPAQTNDTAETISKASNRPIDTKYIFWDPEPEAMVDNITEDFKNFIDQLREDPSVHSIYTNVNRNNDYGF